MDLIANGESRNSVKNKIVEVLNFHQPAYGDGITDWGVARSRLNAVATAWSLPTLLLTDLGGVLRSKLNAIVTKYNAGGLYPWAAGAAMWRNFAANDGNLPAPTDVHAAAIMGQNVAGVWSSFAANVPVLTDAGFQTVPTRTNLVRNSALTGAVVGNPGTLPNQFLAPLTNGWTTKVVGIGTTIGLPYVDLLIEHPTGANGNGFINLDSNQIVLPSLNPITVSTYCQMVAGSLSNITGLNGTLEARTSGNVSVPSQSVSIADFRATVSQALPRMATMVPTDPTVERVVFYLRITPANLGPISITLRIFGAQAEIGAFASPPILTTGTAATVAGNIQLSTGLATQLATGVGGFITSDVKGFDPAALPVLIGIEPSSQVAQALMAAAIESTSNLATGLQTIAFAASEGYAKVRVVGQADIASVATRYPTNLDRVSYGGNGFDAANNLYAVHKRVALRFGTMNDTIFNDIYAKAAL